MGTLRQPGRNGNPDEPCNSRRRSCRPDKIKVVKLVEVVLHSGQEKHQPAKGRKQYINLDSSIEPNTPHPEYGRFIRLKARVQWASGDRTQPLAGQTVYWYSKPGSRNIRNLPGDLKEGFVAQTNTGAASAGRSATATSTVDANGWTYVHFYLSRYGGDQFDAYVTDKPAFTGGLKAGTYVVWRKFWYQVTRANTHTVPAPAKSIAAYKKVYSEMVAADQVLFTEAETRAVRGNPGVSERTFYPSWMVKSGASEAKESVIGTHNRNWFFNKFKAETNKPVKGHLIVCQNQWDPAETRRKIAILTTNPSEELTFEGISDNGGFLKPALAGNLVVSGTWRCGLRSGQLTDDNILIERGRSSLNVVRVKLPPGAPVPTRMNQVTVSIRLNYGEFWGGESIAHNMLITHDGDDKSFNQVVSHEFGHGFGQTPEVAQPPLVRHPNQYQQHGGSGSHCHTNADITQYVYKNGTCIMFHQLNPAGCTQLFCNNCEPYLKLQNFSRI